MVKPKEKAEDDDAVERMNKALKAALETPPTKHKDEPKRVSRPSRTPGRAKSGHKSKES